MSNIKIGYSYTHARGIEVLTQDFIKIRVAGIWVDGVTYLEGGKRLYCRTLEDFESRFKLTE